LLDINNLFVTACNFGFDAKKYMDNIDIDKISEIHLAGHIIKNIDNQIIRIDTHNTHICQEVLDLYLYFKQKCQKNIPIIIEWDDNIPKFQILEQELQKVKSL
jgi:uncharacterized protein (UPF0276 family)